MIILNLTHGEIQLSEPGYRKSKVGCIQRELTKCSNVHIRAKMQKSIELTLRILSYSVSDFQNDHFRPKSTVLSMELAIYSFFGQLTIKASLVQGILFLESMSEIGGSDMVRLSE